jgi:hypothetical protein
MRFRIVAEFGLARKELRARRSAQEVRQPNRAGIQTSMEDWPRRSDESYLHEV